MTKTGTVLECHVPKAANAILHSGLHQSVPGDTCGQFLPGMDLLHICCLLNSTTAMHSDVLDLHDAVVIDLYLLFLGVGRSFVIPPASLK